MGINDHLHVGASGKALVWASEGCKLKAYRDSAGIWTIGRGHTSAAGAPAVKPGMTITQAEADEIFQRDILKYENDVKRDVTVVLNQNQFDALLSFDYNCGEGAQKRVVLLAHLNAGRYDLVPSVLRLFTHSGGQILPGLVKRRAAEAKLFETLV